MSQSDDPRFAYHRNFPLVVATDINYVEKKDVQYGASWKKRGGVGAFFMLSRKWDRLEEFMRGTFHYDIFAGITADPSGADGTVLAEIRDLRRYLLNVEAEMIEQGDIPRSHYDVGTFTEIEPTPGAIQVVAPQSIQHGDQFSWDSSVGMLVPVHKPGELSPAQETMKRDMTSIAGLFIGDEVSIKFAGDDVIARVLDHETRGGTLWFKLEDDAGNPYTRTREQIEKPPAAGAARAVIEAAPEPLAGPVEPSATSQATTLAGDTGEAPTVLPFSHEVRREPVLLTNFEYLSLKGHEILHGSLYSTAHSEHHWQDLYWQKDDGRWEMHPQHQEEYGK